MNSPRQQIEVAAYNTNNTIFNFKANTSVFEGKQKVTAIADKDSDAIEKPVTLLAKLGLPPGANVDRASLEKARQANWNFSRYEILPDRIVFYLWAQADGKKFEIKFRPRFGTNAQTPASIVYDLYNSKAQATVAPLKFR